MCAKGNQWKFASALMVVLVTATPSVAQDAEIVVEWNRILQMTVITPGALPPTVFVSRPYALMHAAVFDALNSIDRGYVPFAVEVGAAAGASRGAAAAQAAHDVLAEMFPNQRAIFDAALATHLARFPGEAGREGARVGAETARRWVELRAQGDQPRLRCISSASRTRARCAALRAASAVGFPSVCASSL
jgi:hypothetical protein